MMYDPKEDLKFNVKIWLVILATLAAIVVAAAIISEVVAAPASQSADQPEFPSAQYLGEGPLSIEMSVEKNYILKPKGGMKFELVLGIDQEYQLAEGARLWETNADTAPTVLYQQTTNLGMVKAGCNIDFLIIDDDVDERVNNFTLNGEVVTLNQGMVVSGKIIVPSDGELMFTANDSISLWFGICITKVTPTPQPSLTPTATGTPMPQNWDVFLPIVNGKNEPPPTPSATPNPDQKVLSMYGDPMCSTYTFPADTAPYYVGGGRSDFDCHLPESWHTAVKTAEGTLVIITQDLGNGKSSVIEALWHGSPAPREYHGEEISFFVKRNTCDSGEVCLAVEAWWLGQQEGVFVDLFSANPPK